MNRLELLVFKKGGAEDIACTMIEGLEAILGCNSESLILHQY